MLQKFQEHINLQFSFLKSKKVLIAISGGVDSVVLTHLLYNAGVEIELAHCNFRLRGKEADKDALFVQKLAEELELNVYIKEFDTELFAEKNGLSIQMAARKLRYDWFNEIITENNLQSIATAHHLDDNLETFLINFTRGTGLEGLTGIPERNGKIVRPLLVFSRVEIEDYAKENNILWREDASNAETKYVRNKIRHQIVPLLKELNSSLLNSFKTTTQNLQQSQQIIDDSISKIKKSGISNEGKNFIKLNIQKLKELSNPKAYLYELLKEYGFTEWNDITDLLEAQSGKQIYSDTHRLVKDRDHFLLERLKKTAKNDCFLIKNEQKSLKTANFTICISEIDELKTTHEKSIIYVDGNLLKYPLQIRKRQEGDYFYPFGMQGKKKLSKFFKDEKFSLIDKENTWLLCSDNKIVWVINHRLDDRFKVSNNTKNIVQIAICTTTKNG